MSTVGTQSSLDTSEQGSNIWDSSGQVISSELPQPISSNPFVQFSIPLQMSTSGIHSGKNDEHRIRMDPSWQATRNKN